MFLQEWKTKPRNDYIILLGEEGDFSKRDPSQEFFEFCADNITNKRVCVYNVDTDSVSDKSIYFDKDNRHYITAKRYGEKTIKMYLDDFT